ncbi:MAG TPA: CHRD domain-containing protein [Dehalococcoidia bacterium]|nr:CHRD domain-containing protein [Dehalococcoidia bacterium]
MLPRLVIGLTAVVLSFAARPLIGPSPQTVQAAPIMFQTDMYGTEQVPAVRTQAWGFVRWFFNEQKTEADYTVDVKGLSGSIVSGADIHRGTHGVNGPAIRHLADGGFIVTSGHMRFSTADLNEMAAGNWYVSLKSVEHPDGELRGQIVLPPSFWTAPEPPAPLAPVFTSEAPAPLILLPVAPLVSPSLQVLSLPTAACDATASVTFKWTPARGALVQWVDLSYDDNGFAEGTYYGYGPLPATDRSLIWDQLPPTTPLYWRVNTLTATGWLPTATGSFIACG